MNPIAIAEYVGAVFVGIMLIGEYYRQDRSNCGKWLKVCSISLLLYLLVDASAYTFTGPAWPFALRYTVNLLAYTGGSALVIFFSKYCEAYIGTKKALNPWIFRIPIILMALCTAGYAAEFIAGHLVVYENGIAVAINDVPLYLRVIGIVVMIYNAIAVLLHAKEIGLKAAILLGVYDFIPVFAFGAAIYTNVDVSVLFGAIAFMLITTILQREQALRIIAEENVHRKLRENYARILALEDDFEVLYDVELDTGRYDIFVKGQTFGSATNNLINSNSFFEDVEKNLDVVYPEDRQGNYDVTRPDFIREALSKDDHFDRYYRLMADGRPAWARMRTVYKDAEKKNIIIGVFNAENDVEAKQISEQKEQLQTAYDKLNDIDRRNVLLHHAIRASTWSYDISAEDEVTAAYYDKYVGQNTAVKITADPMSWTESIHPEDRQRVLTEFMAAIRDHTGETPYETTYRILGADGSYLWAKTSGRLSRKEDGTAELIGISINITEQIEEQQKHLLGAMPLATNDVLAKANIGLWAFELDEGQPPRMYDDETMLGLVGLDHQVTPEEAYHAWYDHIDEGSYDLVTDAVNKMISGEHAEVQYPWHFPDGRTIIVRCGGIRNPEYTKGIRIEGTHQNVTETLHFDEEERKRAEQQKNDEIARIKAESSDKAKTEFLFNMSHDIRTPMNAIIGYTDIALNHIGEPERVSDSLKKIKTSGNHLLSLINDILEMSRIEAGKMEIIETPVNAYDVSEGITNMSQALAATRDITFTTEIADLKNPYVYADELHVNQVIINLISNAIKYTNPGGSVLYRIEQISDPADGVANYRLTVKDNGIGMSEEFQKHLFESFSREKSPTVSKQEGAGLGLAIVKRILDLIGGTISVRSKQGEGSVFVVEMPLRVMEAEAIETYKATHEQSTEISRDAVLEGRRVLVVEDNEMNREIAAEILQEAGLVTEAAEDGAIAVRKVTEKGTGYYDYILMDVQMPVMNGYEATRAIRALPDGAGIPIIALSANAFEEDRQKSLAAGMNAHVAKPIDVKILLATMKSLSTD